MKDYFYTVIVIGIIVTLVLCLYFFTKPGQLEQFYSSTSQTLNKVSSETFTKGKENSATPLTRPTTEVFKETTYNSEIQRYQENSNTEENLSYIVNINIEWTPEGYLTESEIETQKNKLKNVKRQIIQEVGLTNEEILQNTLNWEIPSFTVILNNKKLEQLKKHPLVRSVQPNYPELLPRN